MVSWSFRAPRALLVSSFSLLAAAASLSACGGAQKGMTHGCPTVKDGASATSWDRWAACVDHGDLTNVDTCRSSMLYVQGMSVAALEASTRCVLSANARDDGRLVAEALNKVVTNDEKVAAIARGFAPNFRFDPHGSSFASVLSSHAEHALGRHLGAMPEATRNELIRTAFGWGLRDLAQASIPFISNPDMIRQQAETIANGAQGSRDLSPVERYALVVTGRWSANDIVACHEGQHRACRTASGENTLHLLAHDTTSRRTSIGASQVSGQLGKNGEDAETAGILLNWLAQPGTPNGEAILIGMRQGMADTRTDIHFRRSVALGANAALCSTEGFTDVSRYAVLISPTPTEPWSLFLDRCIDQFWTVEDLLRVAAHGGDIHANAGQRTAMDTKLKAELDAVDCSTLTQLGERVATWKTSRVPMNGIVWSELARLEPRCASSFSPKLKAVVSNSAAHPEARYAAIAALAANGDRSSCSQRTAVSAWDTERSGVPVGPATERRQREAQQACR